MPWSYNQTTGELRKDGILAGRGYSGHGNGVNNPELEAVAEVGPIPCGWWTIYPPRNSPKTGPYTLPLRPDKDTVIYGRSAFELHGDSKEHPGQASHGCIAAPLNVRHRVWQSGDTRLQVVSGFIAPDITGEISM